MKRVEITTIGKPIDTRQKQRQAKLAALAKKKEQGKLTLEDVDEKLDVIIKILQDLMPPK